MGRRRECRKRTVALFTAQEVQRALYEKYPERYKDVPDGATLHVSIMEDGIRVEILE